MNSATKIKTITKEELKNRLQRREPIQVVNVLDPKYYGMGNIKGSRKIPLLELDKRYTELDKSREVVVYCADTTCQNSHKAGDLLAAKGFQVSVYEGGIKEWTSAGLPTDESPSAQASRRSQEEEIDSAQEAEMKDRPSDPASDAQDQDNSNSKSRPSHSNRENQI